jgi:hypothetical protein
MVIKLNTNNAAKDREMILKQPNVWRALASVQNSTTARGTTQAKRPHFQITPPSLKVRGTSETLGQKHSLLYNQNRERFSNVKPKYSPKGRYWV